MRALQKKGVKRSLEHRSPALNLSPPDMRRLAFVKYLFLRVHEQKDASDLHAAADLLTLHDAIEMFLALACEVHGAQGVGRRPQFDDFFDPLSKAVGIPQLPEHLALARLNKARVGLKHHGVVPASTEVAAHRHTAASFFEDATPLVFGIDFDRISMALFIEPAEARSAFEAAERLAGQELLKDAAEQIGIAFEWMLRHYTALSVPSEGKQAFRAFGRHRWLLSFEHGLTARMLAPQSAGELDGLVRAIQRDMEEVINPMQEVVRMLALGLDFRKYAQFTSLLPHVSIFNDGQAHVRWRGNVQQALTPAYLRFCLAYVVECAVSLGSFQPPE